MFVSLNAQDMCQAYHTNLGMSLISATLFWLLCMVCGSHHLHTSVNMMRGGRCDDAQIFLTSLRRLGAGIGIETFKTSYTNH